MDMAMELRHLRYFIAVAEEKHVTRAAERLGIQQPPLSQLIKAIERELDVQLFHRKPRWVELTDAGRALLDDARAILDRLDHAIEGTRRSARGEQGRISLGIASTAHFHPFVPGVIRAFRESFPLVSLTLEEGATSELIERLRNEEVDVAFIRTPFANTAGLVFNPLFEEKMLVALPSRHALARAERNSDEPILLKALSAETFILYRRKDGPGLPEVVIAACHAAGFNPRIGQDAPRPASALNFVASGLGITIVPISLQRMHLDGVVYRRLRGTNQPIAPLNLVSRRGDPSAVVRQFQNLVKRAVKKFSADQRDAPK
jgi:DNA-binding transcriptional LysR family regulator